MKKTSLFFTLLFLFLLKASKLETRTRRDYSASQYPIRNDECTKRSMGRFNPYYYVYNGYFHSYNWRINPLTVDRLLGPQAFFGPTS